MTILHRSEKRDHPHRPRLTTLKCQALLELLACPGVSSQLAAMQTGLDPTTSAN
jgi:hypothetical protein